METTYYTLQALVREWTPGLTGAVVRDVFSQTRDELTVVLEGTDELWRLQASVRPAFHFLFRSTGYSRARRNVATLFEETFGLAVTGLRLADRDRLLDLELEGGGRFRFVLFGPRANVLHVDGAGVIRTAFQQDADLTGRPAPLPRPAPRVDSPEAFEARWRPDRRTLAHAVAAAVPLMDRTLAAEVVDRAGLPAGAEPSAIGPEERRALFEAARALERDLEHPAPRIYWSERYPEVFSLVPLRTQAGLRDEPFETVDDALEVYVRRRLATERFRQVYEPLEKALLSARDHHRRSAERMLEELTRESRADRYEHWGHLLMAAPGQVAAGAEEAELPDLFEEGAPVSIPLDPALSAVENATRYYEKARHTRQSRAHAEDRLAATERQAEEAEALLAALRESETYADVEAFKKQEGDRLARYLGQKEQVEGGPSFRRYALAGGYEVWVGRNARQNDELTFRYAQKYDLWMHARGVPGSHTVLRLPSRQAQPGRAVLEAAASVAAYYSKARGSHLVPVVVTPRKYVRKPKGAPVGTVVIEREDVLLVEPALPPNAG